MATESISLRIRLDLQRSNGRWQVVSAANLGAALDGWPQDRIEFGKALRHARQQAGLSQDKFALKAGITSATVRYLEQGRHPASPQVRACITQLLAKLGQAPPSEPSNT